MDEPVIYREEVIRLLFAAYDVALVMNTILHLLTEADDDGEAEQS